MSRCLIVARNMERRKRLRQVLGHEQNLGEVVGVSDPKAALELVSEKKRYDFVFVSTDFSREDTINLISETRKKCEHNSTKKVIFVEVLNPEEADEKRIAESMTIGFHGFICEPFSVDSVKEIAALADKVSRKETFLRLRAATGLVLRDLKDPPPDVDTKQSPQNSEKRNIWKEVDDSCRWYNRITAESLTQFMQNKLSKMPIEDRIQELGVVTSRAQKVHQHVRMFFKKSMPGFDYRRSKKPRKGFLEK
jgi:CheY-like chemotaxis protein